MGVSGLFHLQQADLEIARVSAHRAALNDGAPERATAAEAVQRLADIRGAIAARQTRLRTLDLDLQSLQAKRKKVETDLYSGRVGNPKELAAMQEELAALDRAKAHLEDEVLGLLEEVERLEPQEREAQARLAAAEASLAQQIATYQRAAAEADREIEHLITQRAQLAASLDEDLLRRYDRLREAKGGVAIVAVRGGTCGGCHITIPERFLRRLEESPDTLAACDGCGRLLFVPR